MNCQLVLIAPHAVFSSIFPVVSVIPPTNPDAPTNTTMQAIADVVRLTTMRTWIIAFRRLHNLGPSSRAFENAETSAVHWTRCFTARNNREIIRLTDI
ncbi:hypothetical protein Y027_4985 [Burkholderia pseudomallei TSV5]|nr:hypothetical protein Y027_4985 [Burkholderia pseudomallei TSV5]KGX52507.1 hypothetical protein Y025_4863 [Burkholderia pseudomallei TSV32]